jgi:hypothetical protein
VEAIMNEVEITGRWRRSGSAARSALSVAAAFSSRALRAAAHTGATVAPAGTITAAVARFTGNWAVVIAAHDRMHEHIVIRSDALTMGVVAQFSETFDSLAAEQILVPAIRGYGERSALARIHTAGSNATVADRQAAEDITPEARHVFRSFAPAPVRSHLPVLGTDALTHVWTGSPVLLAVRGM